MNDQCFNSPHIISLILLLDFVGAALSDTGTLYDGPKKGWSIYTGPVSSQILSWFPYGADQYSVCDTTTTDREPTNWLRTDFIDIKDAIRVDISIYYTMRKCKPSYKYCKENFKLYAYQTSNKTSTKPNPLVTSFDLIRVAKPTIIPDRPAGLADTNVMNVSIRAESKGMFLAFYDQGACLSLLKVYVSYNYCPEKEKDLVTYVRTASPYYNSSANQVEGKCMDPHSKNTTALTAACMSQGHWKMNNNVRCLCQAGYGYSNERCIGCVSGKYKSEMSNTLCQSCPKNSAPNTQRTACICHQGYYRLRKHPHSVPCEALPNGPSCVNASTLNTSAIMLTWTPIISKNKSITYSVDCFKCMDNEDGKCIEQCSSVVLYSPSQDNIKSTRVSVSGLPSGTRFKFKVYGVAEINEAASRSDWKHKEVYGNTEKAVSFKCWMCPGGESSFKLCDDNKVEQQCKQIYTRCATFSYDNKTNHRIYAKSCTSEDFCSANNTFCAGIIGGGKACRVQCCDTELCNVQVGFATTDPPTTLTQPTEPSSTPRPPQTTAREPTTAPTTDKPILTPKPDPQDGLDDEDCGWVDASASASSLVSGIELIIGVCLLFASL